MNEQDIINLILGEPEDDFHGTVPSKDKRLRFDRLRGHAGARCRCDGRRRGPGHLRPPQRLPDTRRAASRCGAERICAETFFHAHGTQRQRIAIQCRRQAAHQVYGLRTVGGMTESEFDAGFHIFCRDVCPTADHVEFAKREQFWRIHLFSRCCS